jgi:pyruvate,orthophosphate dikinase
MNWCEKATKMTVRTNADSPSQVENAIAFGATGIGLCRTEHMFFEGNRIDAMRQMILADNEADRRKALKKLLPYQRKDFQGIFKALEGRPATIRLLDPPLHEFLPHDLKAQRDLAKKLGVSLASIKKRVEDLHEFNPMLGHRGCRLGVSYPEITEMQAQAILEAAILVQKSGVEVNPEIMVPLVGFPRELELQVEVIHETAKKVFAAKGEKVKYLVGTMIEIPRAALVADEIAKTAQFFSFGTNDLTQTTMGMSRDDSGSFLPHYTELDIIDANPFASVDQSGVGQLMQIGVKNGKAGRRNIKLGICGEHGGDPKSVEFCHKIGLHYVSCSPFRVPTARLAAAQAAVS